MDKINLQDIRDIFRKIIVPFYLIERDNTLPVPSHRPDNDAEHSWSLALLAIVLASGIDKNLDVGKVGIYAIVHDVVEVYSGDISVWATKEDKFQKVAKERSALAKLKKEFPMFPNLIKYIEEYGEHKDNESQFVYALDKFLNLFTVAEDKGFFYKKNKISRERYLEQLADHRTKAHTHPKVAYYYEKLREDFDSDPSNFFIPKK